MDNALNFSPIKERLNIASRQFEEIITSLRYGEELAIDEIITHILPVVKEASDTADSYQLLYELHDKNEYMARHTLSVSVLSRMMGKWINLEDEELDMLTIGSILHDIGNTRIDPSVLSKEGKLTREEYEEIKLHPIYGYEMLRKIEALSDRVALIALQHHEREDGRGYPKGLVGNQIDLFAKIVAISDMFHAMLSVRAYQLHEMPFSLVMKRIHDDSFGRIDAQMGHMFICKMMESIIGHEVCLIDGRNAKVVMIHPADPLFPLIEVGGSFVDLRENRALLIDKILKHV